MKAGWKVVLWEHCQTRSLGLHRGSIKINPPAHYKNNEPGYQSALGIIRQMIGEEE